MNAANTVNRAHAASPGCDQQGGAIPLARIAHAFGQAAVHYDQHAALQRAVADQLLERINAPAATMLDLGSGTGYCAAKLAARFPGTHLVALDVALPMLRASAARLPEATQLVCGDLHALPLHGASSDLVVCSLALQWSSTPQQVFAELWRVLRPGGRALLSTFGPATLQELRAAWRAADTHVHVNAFTGGDSLRQAATAAGFAVTLDGELMQKHYASLRALARELKGIGAHNMNAARPPALTPRAAFARAEAAFARGCVADGGVPVTWEVYYLDLRKPS